MGTSSSKKDTRPSKAELRLLLKETNYDEETIVAWYQVFTRYSGGSHVIKTEDLLALCSKYDRRRIPSGQKVGRLFCSDDSDQISFSDFLTAQHVASHGSQAEKLARLFRLCDTDQDGEISFQDLRNTFPDWGKDTEDRVRQELFSMDNNTISRHDFIRKCQGLISNKDL